MGTSMKKKKKKIAIPQCLSASAGWTCEHPLIGQVVMQGRALIPFKTQQTRVRFWHGSPVNLSVTIARFHPEDTRARQPALWRGVLRQEEHQETEEVSSESFNTIARALDFVASDLMSRTFSLVPMSVATVEDRLSQVIYQHILTNYLPQLIMIAASEEIQAQFLKQYLLRPQKSSVQEEWSDQPKKYYTKAPNSYLVAPVATVTSHKLNPESESSFSFPSFTPSQLTYRIKQGCHLIWKHYSERLYPVPILEQVSTAAAIASVSADNRRSSSRLSAIRQSHPELEAPKSIAVVSGKEGEPSDEWKVLPGGKIALYIQKKIVNSDSQTQVIDGELKSTDFTCNVEATNFNVASADNELLRPAEKGANHAARVEQIKSEDENESRPSSPLGSTEEVAAEEDFDPQSGNGEIDGNILDKNFHKECVQEHVMETPRLSTTSNANKVENEGPDVVEDATVGEDVDLLIGNPYFTATAAVALEWLGQKTSKLLSVSDLQEVFSNLLEKSKKKAKKTIGVQVQEILTSHDKILWHKIDESMQLSPTSQVTLRLTTEHEDERVEKWDTAYFGRAHFTIGLSDDTKRQRGEDDQMNELLAAYKVHKAWDSRRYKGIHSGYAIWPSWNMKQRGTDASSIGVDSKTEDFSVGSDSKTEDFSLDRVAIIQIDPNATDNDLAVAHALHHDMMGDGSSRRNTRRGGDSSGVFYGNQSNITSKQLMDTICRLVSEKKFLTAASLVEAIPDESTDPLRRIRAAIGKLVWRRNQISTIHVQSEQTDESLRLQVLNNSLIEYSDRALLGDDNMSIVNLIQYVRSLHETELILRQILLKRLTQIPVVLVATAADERPGSMEALDSIYFEDSASITWILSGDDLLGKCIHRPLELTNTDDLSICNWFRIVAYCETIASIGEAADEVNAIERSNIGSAKDPKLVKRRKRYQAVMIRNPTDEHPLNGDASNTIILTEAQVHAGVKAASLTRQATSSSLKNRCRNPFSDGSKPQVSLFPLNGDSSASSPVSGIVVGHKSSFNNKDGKLFHHILVLPQKGSSREDALWVQMDIKGISNLQCTIDGIPTVYTLKQHDHHSLSPEVKECRAIIFFLHRHPKSFPFLHPVDPVQLQIPSYPDIVKNPMDITTLSKKLENGDYSHFGVGQSTGECSIARMLNGPFRKDLELIFRNAMLFNAPDDWIYQAAVVLLKAVSKKIDQAVTAAEHKTRSTSHRSMYVDDDSDVDMYDNCESDDYDTSMNRKKRKRFMIAAPNVLKEDPSTRVIERPFRLQKLLNEVPEQRGPFSDLPIYHESKSFSLPQGWTCRHRNPEVKANDCSLEASDVQVDELCSLYLQMEGSQSGSLRRSRRKNEADGNLDEQGSNPTDVYGAIEYVLDNSSSDFGTRRLPRTRHEVELERERSHEEYFAKLWQENYKAIRSTGNVAFGTNIGMFVDGNFPPYLGRMIPSGDPDGYLWEIREPYVVVALRWVLRGLIHSGHLTEMDPMQPDSLSSGSIIPNNTYTINDGDPFDEIDIKDLSRRKRTDQESAPNKEDIALSKYEKERLERVARNEERLRALGLA